MGLQDTKLTKALSIFYQTNYSSIILLVVMLDNKSLAVSVVVKRLIFRKFTL